MDSLLSSICVSTTMSGPVQLHAVFFITHAIALSYDIFILVHPTCERDTFMGCSVFRKLYFLTFWTQIIQTVYYGMNVVNDLFGTNNPPISEKEGRRKRCQLENFRNRYLSSIAFPSGIFVVMTFWSLYYVDRELVHPKFLDKVVPQWLNHVMHTAPLVFLIMDKYIVYHHYPSKPKGMFTTVMFASAYNVWILFIAYYGQIWVYPVFEILNTVQRLLFFLMLWVFMISIYILGESITKFFWRKERAQVNLKER